MRSGVGDEATPNSPPEREASQNGNEAIVIDNARDAGIDGGMAPERKTGEDTTQSFTKLSAGPTWTPQSSSRDTDDNSSRNDVSGMQSRREQYQEKASKYEDAGFVSLDEADVEEGTFIRYLKEDGVIYQGTVLSGTPVENGFNYYSGQDDDVVVQLNFDSGKHVAPNIVQHTSRINVLNAEHQTARGRPLETVSPEEILAFSPEYMYDWIRIADAWDTDTEKPRQLIEQSG